jgi:hypothetical protein
LELLLPRLRELFDMHTTAMKKKKEKTKKIARTAVTAEEGAASDEEVELFSLDSWSAMCERAANYFAAEGPIENVCADIEGLLFHPTKGVDAIREFVDLGGVADYHDLLRPLLKDARLNSKLLIRSMSLIQRVVNVELQQLHSAIIFENRLHMLMLSILTTTQRSTVHKVASSVLLDISNSENAREEFARLTKATPLIEYLLKK